MNTKHGTNRILITDTANLNQHNAISQQLYKQLRERIVSNYLLLSNLTRLIYALQKFKYNLIESLKILQYYSDVIVLKVRRTQSPPILCLIPRMTVTSLIALQDTRCKTHPVCVNPGVPFWTREKTHKFRARDQASSTGIRADVTVVLVLRQSIDRNSKEIYWALVVSIATYSSPFSSNSFVPGVLGNYERCYTEIRLFELTILKIYCWYWIHIPGFMYLLSFILM